MTSCCRAGPCEQMFKARVARRSLRRYTEKGLDQVERRMVESAVEGGLEGARVLEIGGGIGAIQTELLEAGAERGEVVELVPAWEPYARELARESGLEERTSFRIADVLDEPDTVEPAEVVVMNRVVCCTPDGIQLTAAAARLARRRLVLSFPRDTVWMRFGIGLVNAGFWVMRRSFRVFVHSREALVAAAESEGLRLADRGRGFAWEFLTLQRAT